MDKKEAERSVKVNPVRVIVFDEETGNHLCKKVIEALTK